MREDRSEDDCKGRIVGRGEGGWKGRGDGNGEEDEDGIEEDWESEEKRRV